MLFGRPVDLAHPLRDLTTVVISGVLGSSMAAVVAGKAVVAMQGGVAYTRWRDWAYILTLARCYSFASHELAQAIASVATHPAVENHLRSGTDAKLPGISAGEMGSMAAPPRCDRWYSRVVHARAHRRFPIHRSRT